MGRKLLAAACITFPFVTWEKIASHEHIAHPLFARGVAALVSIVVAGILWNDVRSLSSIWKSFDRILGLVGLAFGALFTFDLMPIERNVPIVILFGITGYAGIRLIVVPPTLAQLAKKEVRGN